MASASPLPLLLLLAGTLCHSCCVHLALGTVDFRARFEQKRKKRRRSHIVSAFQYFAYVCVKEQCCVCVCVRVNFLLYLQVFLWLFIVASFYCSYPLKFNKINTFKALLKQVAMGLFNFSYRCMLSILA